MLDQKSFQTASGHAPATQGLIAPDPRVLPRLSNAEEVRTFHARAVTEAQSFNVFFKAPDGAEPQVGRLMAREHSARIDGWLESSEGRRVADELGQRVISFVEGVVGMGMPGHDARHVLYKDPLSALRMIVKEDLSPSRALSILPALLHDVGRLYEHFLYDKPAGGVGGSEHAIVGFLITKELLGDVLERGTSDPELADALGRLKNEILNAVLDHQRGGSRSSYLAQVVQRADREQLVGYEMLHRSFAFDVGIQGLSIAGGSDPKCRERLPMPGSSEMRNIFHHLEFYMRNLHDNIGATAREYAEQGKIQTGRFLWLSCPPEMRARIFHPELTRDGMARRHLETHATKRPLLFSTWGAVPASASEISALDVIRGGRSLESLMCEFIHPTHAARSDASVSGGWDAIKRELGHVTGDLDKHLGRGLVYALSLRASMAKESGEIIAAAKERFTPEGAPLLHRVVMLVEKMHKSDVF